MIAPITDEAIAQAKAECVKRYGHDRLIAVDFASPVDGSQLATFVFADLSWQEVSDYHDARFGSIARGRSMLMARMLVPSGADMASVRAEWPAVDVKLEGELRTELGLVERGATHVVLSAKTAPPGLDAASAQSMLASSGGVRLWAVKNDANGLSCVLRQPQPEIWALGSEKMALAVHAKQGLLCPILDMICDHCAWCPGLSLRAHVEERPGRGEDLAEAWYALGGAAAKTARRRF